MAHRLVQVSFRWIKAVPDEAELRAAIDYVCADWCRLNLFTWYLWTERNPTEVYAGLSRIVKDEDSVVAVAIDHTVMPFGWAPQFFWDWANPKILALNNITPVPAPKPSGL